MEIKPKKETTKIPGTFDPSTGELISTEGITTVISTNPTIVETSYKEYVVIDSQALNYLKTLLNKPDLGRLVEITNMVHTPFNALVHEYNPPRIVYHSAESLRVALDFSSAAMFRQFIKRLVGIGVLYELKGLLRGTSEVGMTYLLNPSFAKKRKYIDKDVLALFTDLSKKGNPS